MTRALKELLLIKYYLRILLDRVIFLLLWRNIKKQVIFIDPSKYEFTYTVERRRLFELELYVPIAQFNTIKFITPEKFTQAKEYNVICLLNN